MAIATKTKKPTAAGKKRFAAHHKQTKHYARAYWPYLPMVAVVAVGLFVNALLGQSAGVLGVQSNFSQQALLDASNLDRGDNKVANLNLNDQLATAAQTKAEDMVKQNYWDHVNPEGKQPWSFIASAGYQYQAAGENLAYGFDSADQVVNAWMNSPEHRANLLSSTYTDVGFGVAQSPDYMGHGTETVVVAMYGEPAGFGVTATVPDHGQGTGETVPTTSAAVKGTSVSRLQTMAAPAISGLIVGILATLAIVLVLIRHSIAWHKMIRKGEAFIIKHPVFDTALVAVVMVAVVLNHTVGFVR